MTSPRFFGQCVSSNSCQSLYSSTHSLLGTESVHEHNETISRLQKLIEIIGDLNPDEEKINQYRKTQPEEQIIKNAFCTMRTWKSKWKNRLNRFVGSLKQITPQTEWNYLHSIKYDLHGCVRELHDLCRVFQKKDLKSNQEEIEALAEEMRIRGHHENIKWTLQNQKEYEEEYNQSILARGHEYLNKYCQHTFMLTFNALREHLEHELRQARFDGCRSISCWISDFNSQFKKSDTDVSPKEHSKILQLSEMIQQIAKKYLSSSCQYNPEIGFLMIKEHTLRAYYQAKHSRFCPKTAVSDKLYHFLKKMHVRIESYAELTLLKDQWACLAYLACQDALESHERQDIKKQNSKIEELILCLSHVFPNHIGSNDKLTQHELLDKLKIAFQQKECRLDHHWQGNIEKLIRLLQSTPQQSPSDFQDESETPSDTLPIHTRQPH